MPDKLLGGRRFNDREIAQIMKRAAELQQLEPGDNSRGMSLRELEQIALEAGIDPALVHRAAADLDAHDDPLPESALTGAPTRLQFERIIDGEVPDSEYGMLVEEIRRTFGMSGVITTLGRTLSWTSAVRPAERRNVSVSIIPRNGVTTIRIDEPLGGVTTAVFGGLVGAGGGGGALLTLGLVMGATGLISVAAPFAVSVACVGYLGARAVFHTVVNRRIRELRLLLDRLSAFASAVAKRPMSDDAAASTAT